MKREGKGERRQGGGGDRGECVLVEEEVCGSVDGARAGKEGIFYWVLGEGGRVSGNSLLCSLHVVEND